MTTSYPAQAANDGENDSTSSAGTNDQELLRHIRRRFDYMVEAWKEIREAGDEDMRALSPEGPWDPEERAARKKAGRPCIHLDQLTQYTNGLMGEVRQSPIAGKVIPTGSGATDKTAQLRGERIRAIEYASNATQATLTALESAVERSYGAFGIGLDYKSWDSDQLEIKYRRFANPDAVLWDPDCRQADWSDMKDGFYFSWIPFDEFKTEFGEDASITTGFTSEHAGLAPTWVDLDKQMVQVAEYYRIEYEPATTKSGRKTKKPKLMQYFTNGIQILDRIEQPIPEVPIFPITGKERFIKDGTQVKRVLYSYIRLAVDGQMLFDYYKTNEAEDVGLTPKPKYAGYEGQFETETDWENINKSSDPFVEFKATVDPVTNQVLPLPRWDSYSPNTQALEIGAEAARRAIQAALGSYGFTRLDDTNVKSGRAIDKLKSQGDLASYHIVDSYKASVQRATRYVNRLLDHVETEAMEVGIRKDDGTHHVVKIHQASTDENGQEQYLRYRETEDAEHDVTITDGPSYQSQREEATAFADTLTQNPEAFAVLGDLVVKLKNLGPIGDEMAERLTPPQFAKDKQQGAIPPEVQQQMQQAQQMIDQLSQQLNAATETIQTKKVETESKERIAQLDRESNERIEQRKTQAELIKTEATLQSKEAQALLEAEIARIENDLAREHEASMQPPPPAAPPAAAAEESTSIDGQA